MSYWQPYLIAIVIGLLVGIEREKAQKSHPTLGVRTFLMISLLGAIAGGIGNTWMAWIVTAFVMGLILLSYYPLSRRQNADRGTTTEFAAAVVFCLGYAAHTLPLLSAIIGPIVALILFSKPPLHRFSQKIKRSELETALLLFLGGVVVTSLVPDQVIDPWNIFNPRKFGYLVLTLATLEFTSYVAVKIFGVTAGSLVSGFFGGLVSSSAVLVSSAKLSIKSKERSDALLSSAIIAKVAALLELLFIVALVAPPLFTQLVAPVSAGMAAGVIFLLLIHQKRKSEPNELLLKSPLEWRGVLRLSLLLSGLIILISFAKNSIGENGALAVSFLAGIFELHGVSLANATILSQQKMTIDSAYQNILVALGASLFGKIGMAWVITHGSFSKKLTLAFSAMALAIAVTAFFFKI